MTRGAASPVEQSHLIKRNIDKTVPANIAETAFLANWVVAPSAIQESQPRLTARGLMNRYLGWESDTSRSSWNIEQINLASSGE